MSLHNHLKNKHPNKVEAEVNNTGEMDKFVTRDIPVSIYFYFYSFFYILISINKKYLVFHYRIISGISC